MDQGSQADSVPARMPLWIVGLSLAFSAILTVYGGIRAFYYQSSFLAPIAYTTDERPTAERYAELLGTSAEDLLTGIHAFFDFLNPYYWGTLANPWLEGGDVLPVNYPPLSMAFMNFWALFPYKTALTLYLPLMAIALVLPIVLALRGVRWSLVLLSSAVVLLSGPAIASLDRGNTQGFIPILLFGFGVMALRGRWGWASVFLVLAASLKIFPALLLLVLIAERRWRALISSGVALILIHTLGFLPYAGDPRESFTTWFDYAFTFLGREDLSAFLEYNASFVGGLAHWAMFAGLSSLAIAIDTYSAVIAVLVTGCIVVLIFLRERLSLTVRLFAAFMTTTTILPVAYPYTANWIIAAAALLFLASAPKLRGDKLDMLLVARTSVRWSSSTVLWGALALSSALLLTFAPVFIPGSMESGYRAGVASLLMPVAVTVALIGMYYFVFTTKRQRTNSLLDPSTAVEVP